ncbi:hypothetical protein ACGFXC_23045 [Streptomyces sp. NPDC048507]|uniref:hypothetical protein n=1 Tax=Streptomyces sp. NPDC048507 TaxID=3365560 RepID=UPI0037222FDD
MGAERAQGGRGWVRIPASRGEQAPAGAAGGTPYAGTPYAGTPYAGTPYAPRSAAAAGAGAAAGAFAPRDPAAIYLSLLKRWREAGRTLPGHPDEEWERLISQPCWPGR